MRSSEEAMKKIVAGVLIMTLLSVGLAGCGSSFNPQADAKIVSLSCVCSHMQRDMCFSFSIYKNESGEVCVDAWYFTDDGENEITHDGLVVGAEALEQLNTLAQQLGLVQSVKDYRRPLFNIHAADKTVYFLGIKMSDGSAKAAQSLLGFSSELWSFFTELCEQHTPVTDGAN